MEIFPDFLIFFLQIIIKVVYDCFLIEKGAYNGQIYAFQCKDHEKKQGNGCVQEAVAARRLYRANRCVLHCAPLWFIQSIPLSIFRLSFLGRPFFPVLSGGSIGSTRFHCSLHAIVDGLGNPVVFLLSPGNDNDSTHAIDLMDKTDLTGSNLLGDKAYGTKEILAYINEHGAHFIFWKKHSTR